MRWDYLFDGRVLAQGKEYFQDGRVSSLTHRGATYQAKVTGSKQHDVEVYLTDRVHPRLYCDCRNAEYNGCCKHAAAVLYAIAEEENKGQKPAVEGRKKKKDNIPKRIYPFSHRWTLLDRQESGPDGTESSDRQESGADV